MRAAGETAIDGARLACAPGDNYPCPSTNGPGDGWRLSTGIPPPETDLTDALTHFFYPQSVAFIGASTDPTKIGGRPLQQTLELGFPGPIYPVNPRADMVQGLPAFAALGDIPDPVDLAVIVVPAPGVIPAIEACAEKSVSLAVILSGGFAELGRQGLAEQDRILDIARQAGLRLIGPNSMGGLSLESRFSATFTVQSLHEGRGWAELGRVSIASQSGFVGSQLMALLRDHGIGIAKWVATGNQCDIDVAECVQHLAEDEITRIIAVYLEGASDGASLMRAFETARDRGKPVIIVKVGSSEVGARAVLSHTASLVGGQRVYDTVFRQCNVHHAASLEELVDVVAACDTGRYPGGTGLGVATASGGIGVIIADRAAKLGYDLPELSPPAQTRIKKVVPLGSAVNPVDMGTMQFFHLALEELLADSAMGTIIAALGHFGLLADAMEIFIERLAEYRDDYPDRFIALATNMVPARRNAFQRLGLFVCEDPSRAVTAAAAARVIGAGFAQAAPDAPPVIAEVDVSPARLAGGEMAAKEILAEIGIPIAPDRLARSADEAVAAAREIGGPVVLKIASAHIQHKSDLGGVLVGLQTGEVGDGFEAITRRIAKAMPEAAIEGVLVSPMIEGGTETIVGVSTDPVFGPVVMFGLGGIFVEIMDDTALGIAPFGADRARALIGETRGVAILEGARGNEPGDIDALAQAIARLSVFAHANSNIISSIDINPLIVLPEGQGVVALDGLILQQPQ